VHRDTSDKNERQRYLEFVNEKLQGRASVVS
jgi:hypothetical protein